VADVEAPGKIALQGVTPADVARLVPAVSLEEARRIIAQVHRGEPISTPSSGIRRVTREAIVARGCVPSLALAAERSSAVDPFVKYAFKTADDHVIETVRIPLEKANRFCVCVSSQVGCALACSFCATGRMGLTRNLETWEIVEQVRHVRLHLPKDVKGSRVHGVVFQGMGEPLANLDRVLKAISVMSEPSGLAIDARNITVCTSGLPTGIRRLAREAPNVRLGLSLGSAIPDTRRRLMPIEKSHALAEEVFEAVVEHATMTTMAPMFAVTLLANVNDDALHAEALAAFVARFRDRSGRSPRLSVIPYNSIGESQSGTPDPFARSAEDREVAFRDRLRDRGVFSHKRYSGGSDVDAACGQLAAR